jgi:hypothetical protein
MANGAAAHRLPCPKNMSGREEFLLLRGDASPEERAAILAVLERRARAMRLAAWRRARQAAVTRRPRD